jgi:hypothetical protein
MHALHMWRMRNLQLVSDTISLPLQNRYTICTKCHESVSNLMWGQPTFISQCTKNHLRYIINTNIMNRKCYKCPLSTLMD